MILNDPQKDLTHCHLPMLKCPTSHVVCITAKNKLTISLDSYKIHEAMEMVVGYCSKLCDAGNHCALKIPNAGRVISEAT